MTDDITDAAVRRTWRTNTKIQQQLLDAGFELEQVIAMAMIGDLAMTLTMVVGNDATELLLRGAHTLHQQHAAMTDLEWAGYQHAALDWAELAVKHLCPRVADGEARPVGAMIADVMWHLGDLVSSEEWVTDLMTRVRQVQ